MRRAFQRAASSCAASTSSRNFTRQRILSAVAKKNLTHGLFSNAAAGLNGPHAFGASRNFGGYINAGAVGLHREGVDTSDPKVNQVQGEEDELLKNLDEIFG
jgi:hypothetical protein